MSEQSPRYQVIASTMEAMANCEASGNDEWKERHRCKLIELIHDMSSGAGFDNGTVLDDTSTTDRLVFRTSYHHMNGDGMYDGWTSHDIVITPSLTSGFDVRVTGKNHNDIKDYIGEVFHTALSEEVERY